MQSENSDNTNTNTGNDLQSNGQSQTSTAGEKKDWLDKGIESIGKKFGMNISDKNADKAGDFANKELKKKGGFNLPGVQ